MTERNFLEGVYKDMKLKNINFEIGDSDPVERYDLDVGDEFPDA